MSESNADKILEQQLMNIAAGEVSAEIDIEPKEKKDLVLVESKSQLDDKEGSSDVVDDYIHGRRVVKTLIDETTASLVDVLELARQHESPRLYSIVNDLVNTTRELTKDMLAMQKMLREIEREERKNGGDGTGATTTVNGDATVNQQIVMSSEDISRFIENSTNGNSETDA